MKGKTAASAPPRRGRPPSETAARENVHFRVTAEHKERWRRSADAMDQDQSDWARDGLDAWTLVCDRARELGVNPEHLVHAALDAWTVITRRADELGANPEHLVHVALEDHARVRVAVSQLERLLKVLKPLEPLD